MDQYLLGNKGMAERFGRAEGVAFRKEASQVAFLVVEFGLGTVFPERGRHLRVYCMCTERHMLPGRGALNHLQNLKENHRAMRPEDHILCHLLVCPLLKFPGLEVCLGQGLSL